MKRQVTVADDTLGALLVAIERAGEHAPETAKVRVTTRVKPSKDGQTVRTVTVVDDD